MSSASFKTGLYWPIKASFARYVAGLADGRAELTGRIAPAQEWGLAFALADASAFDRSTGEGTLKFAGAIRFQGHFGMLRLEIAEPWLRISGGGGIVSVASEGHGRLDLASFQLRWGASDEASGFGEDVLLDPGAVKLFGGVYGEGMLLDPFMLQLGL